MGSPSILAAQADAVLARINELNAYATNHLIGGVVTDGGTTQLTGDATAPNFDADATAVVSAVVNGKVHGKAAATDLDDDGASAVNFAAASGKSVVMAVVFTTGADNDTPAWITVAGAVAATGAEKPPTDSEITTALTHANWLRAADFTINRTGATTVTVAIDNNVRPGVPANPLAVTNAELRS